MLLFVGFMVIGSLYTNLFMDAQLNEYSTIIDFLKTKIESESVSKTALYEFIVFNRLKLYGILWIAGFTIFAFYVDAIATSYFGFSFGLILSLSLIVDGITSYLFVVLLLVPQYIIYIPLYIYLINRNSAFSTTFIKNRKISKSNKINGQLLVEYVFVLIICCLFIFIGAFLESFVNLEVIKWYFLTKNM
jgi:stage II sporulation protein M